MKAWHESVRRQPSGSALKPLTGEENDIDHGTSRVTQSDLVVKPDGHLKPSVTFLGHCPDGGWGGGGLSAGGFGWTVCVMWHLNKCNNPGFPCRILLCSKIFFIWLIFISCSCCCSAVSLLTHTERERRELAFMLYQITLQQPESCSNKLYLKKVPVLAKYLDIFDQGM